MNTLDISNYYRNIDFLNRYQEICANHNDFDNSLRGNKKALYDEVINHYAYNVKYYRAENFYRIEEENNGILFVLTLTLKDGLVEVMINLKFTDGWGMPGGRLDFLALELDPNFDRENYNLPMYGTAEELKEILDEIFNIYEDLKREFI